MDYVQVGSVIRALRQEKGMTQKQLADRLHLSDKTVSKWERGLGCPDVSLLTELSAILEVNISEMLSGGLSGNRPVSGNMKRVYYFVCPSCGSVSFCTGKTTLFCCGRALSPLKMQKAEGADRLTVTPVEDEWLIETAHPASCSSYISFIAFVTEDSLQVYKQYPEWTVQTRIPRRRHGQLVWYSTTKGLFYQTI
ncbi:MAG: helix-turn-helix domain-containing protein [Clostridia bacterium]